MELGLQNLEVPIPIESIVITKWIVVVVVVVMVVVVVNMVDVVMTAVVPKVVAVLPGKVVVMMGVVKSVGHESLLLQTSVPRPLQDSECR